MSYWALMVYGVRVFICKKIFEIVEKLIFVDCCCYYAYN